jgi:hypothetical protein
VEFPQHSGRPRLLPILVEAAWAAIKTEGRLRARYDRLVRFTAKVLQCLDPPALQVEVASHACGMLTCRRELLDRTLIWNQRHLLRALREFEASTTSIGPSGHRERPPLHHCRRRSPIRTRSSAWTYEDTNVWAESSTSTSMPLDLHE